MDYDPPMVRALISVVIAAIALIGCTATPQTDVPRPEQLGGQQGTLVAFVFISTECPIANAMVPDIRSIAAEARAMSIPFHAVHAAPGAESAAVAAHAREFGLDGAVDVVIDRDQSLVRALGATITPEAVLVRLDGHGGFERLYIGRVNDLYAAIGRRRASATSNDFLDAMRAAHSGKPVAQPAPKAVGCFIELKAP